MLNRPGVKSGLTVDDTNEGVIISVHRLTSIGIGKYTPYGIIG